MDAILLAAGNSLRFGANKLLYQFEGKPLYRYALEALYQRKLERGVGRLIVVSQYAEVFGDVRGHFPGVEMIRNPMPERGISSSIRLGIACLEKKGTEKTEACLFAVADQPYLCVDSLKGMEMLFQREPYGIVSASHGGKRGNPVIFSSRYYGELKSLKGDTGGKQVLLRHMEDVGFYEVPLQELKDLDRPEDIAETEGRDAYCEAPMRESFQGN